MKASTGRLAGLLCPHSVIQRWATRKMPVTKEGRFLTTSTEVLNAWLGKESGKPVHAATETNNLTADLNCGLVSFARKGGQLWLHGFLLHAGCYVFIRAGATIPYEKNQRLQGDSSVDCFASAFVAGASIAGLRGES
jgi:hypothetical protein